jgi:hypothetical protein
MEMKSEEKKAKAEEFLLEDSALKRLKLREKVYYPDRSYFRHKAPLMQIAAGAVICLSILFLDSASWHHIIFGNLMMLFGIFYWIQEEAKMTHDRIDKLLELKDSEKGSHIQAR